MARRQTTMLTPPPVDWRALIQRTTITVRLDDAGIEAAIDQARQYERWQIGSGFRLVYGYEMAETTPEERAAGRDCLRDLLAWRATAYPGQTIDVELSR